MKRFLLLMIVVLAVGALAPTAHAGLSVYLDDLSTVTAGITVDDQSVDDKNPALGAVTYIGSFDNWTINVTTGISKPAIGGVTDPQLDLSSVNTSSSTAGLLLIMATDTGFSAPPGWGGQATLLSYIGGTTEGTVTFEQVLDLDNKEFATTGALSVSLGPFGPPKDFSGSGADAGSVSGDFSLTEIVYIDHPGAGETSFDASSEVVPVPAAVLLGILGLGVAGWKLRKYA